MHNGQPPSFPPATCMLESPFRLPSTPGASDTAAVWLQAANGCGEAPRCTTSLSGLGDGDEHREPEGAASRLSLLASRCARCCDGRGALGVGAGSASTYQGAYQGPSMHLPISIPGTIPIDSTVPMAFVQRHVRSDRTWTDAEKGSAEEGGGGVQWPPCMARRAEH